MIESNSETKNVYIIWGFGTLENLLLLFGKRMRISSNNSDKDRKGTETETETYAEYHE